MKTKSVIYQLKPKGKKYVPALGLKEIFVDAPTLEDVRARLFDVAKDILAWPEELLFITREIA